MANHCPQIPATYRPRHRGLRPHAGAGLYRQDRGHITDWKDDDIASALDVETEQVAAIRQAMQGKVLDGDLVTGWRKRQPQREDPASTARVRAFRERRKQAGTPSHAVKRGETHGNAPDADADQESPQKEEVGERTWVGAQPQCVAAARAAARPTQSARAPKEPLPACPDWLTAETWQAFIQHRAAKRKPLTPQAARLILRDLDKARRFGHDPVTLIEAAIAAGWTGCVFEDRHFNPAANTPLRTRQTQPPTAKHTEWDAILDSLNRPAIEGKALHECH